MTKYIVTDSPHTHPTKTIYFHFNVQHMFGGVSHFLQVDAGSIFFLLVKKNELRLKIIGLMWFSFYILLYRCIKWVSEDLDVHPLPAQHSSDIINPRQYRMRRDSYFYAGVVRTPARTRINVPLFVLRYQEQRQGWIKWIEGNSFLSVVFPFSYIKEDLLGGGVTFQFS